MASNKIDQLVEEMEEEIAEAKKLRASADIDDDELEILINAAGADFKSRKKSLLANLGGAVPPGKFSSNSVNHLVELKNKEIAAVEKHVEKGWLTGDEEIGPMLAANLLAYNLGKKALFDTLRAELNATKQPALLAAADETELAVPSVPTESATSSSSSSSQPSVPARQEAPLLALVTESCMLFSGAATEGELLPAGVSSTPVAPSKVQSDGVVEKAFVYDSPPGHDNPFGNDYHYEADIPASTCGSDGSASVYSVTDSEYDTQLDQDRTFAVTEADHDRAVVLSQQKRTYRKRNVVTPDTEQRRSVRHRYPIVKLDPSAMEFVSITEEYAYKISDKLRADSAKVTNPDNKDYDTLRFKYDAAWIKKRGIGAYQDWERHIYVNPDGVGYVLERNPVLGIDFFLNPQDALEYCASRPQKSSYELKMEHYSP